MLIHHQDGSWVALSAVCTHLGCTVQYEPQANRIHCACHGGVYDPRTGANVSANVTFAPWLLAAAPSGNCFGGNVPATANQCKNGGWMTSVRSDGSTFKNQGDCIQYVNTGK